MSEQTCGNCKWLKMSAECWTKHDPPRLKPNAGGQCTWPIPGLVLAHSITGAYGFRDIGSSRSYMMAKHAGCPTWEAKETA